MPAVCIVDGCESYSIIKGIDGEEIKISFFKPNSEETLRAWMEVIPTKKKKVLTKSHTVCELHFSEEVIEKYYITILPDGTEHRIRRGKAVLKAGAVPSIFFEKSPKPEPEPEPVCIEELDEIDFEIISRRFQEITLPTKHWMVECYPEYIIWIGWTDYEKFFCKRVILYPDMKIRAYIGEVEIDLVSFGGVKNLADVSNLLGKISECLPCLGASTERPENCAGYVLRIKKGTKGGRQSKFCQSCSKIRIKMNRKKRRPGIENKLRAKKYKLQERYTSAHRKSKRLERKVEKMKEKVRNLKEACSKVKEETLLEAISELPESQQAAVKACFQASKMSNMKGMRYTRNWMYECLLLRIKSKKTYEHLRRHGILVLPSPSMLSKYMRRIKTSYGFQPYVFEGIKVKTSAMPLDLRHGVLSADEMKLSKALTFNRIDLKVEGFTNLGDYTPEHQASKKGDHALVLMFQPFKGKWVQSLACFLSLGSASETVLHKIILEAILLCEDAGLCIDAVVTDGVSWNRAMWKKFGVTEENISVCHPACDERRLWFLSDFPHLVKALRNFLIKFSKYDIIFTPDGPVSLKHWFALLELIDEHSYGLKVNYKLRKDHVQPRYYQKMNVALAFQFFNIHDALAIYENKHPDLEDCEGSKKFCETVTNLIRAMNCRVPMNAMAPGNETWKVVEKFLEYVKEWEKIAKEKNYEFFSDNCCYGLKISLKAALEICKFLVEGCGFDYLMTARLNQDCLERFFGMMRDCCGSNDHPDSALFIQMFKLVSTYSLVKPPKGCNITSNEVFDVLLSVKDVENPTERKEQWEAIVDTILDKGCASEIICESIAALMDHDYSLSEASEYALTYVAGYVSRKGSRLTNFTKDNKFNVCIECSSSLILSPDDTIPERHKLIELKSRGSLKHPSIRLYNLIYTLEHAIMGTISEEEINVDTLFHITGKLQDLPIPFVGCKEHAEALTRRILIFYLTTRMFLICKQNNKNNNKESEETREKRKSSKLVNVTERNTENDFQQRNCCEDSSEITKKKKR